jgi:hypothetical protein
MMLNPTKYEGNTMPKLEKSAAPKPDGAYPHAIWLPCTGS